MKVGREGAKYISTGASCLSHDMISKREIIVYIKLMGGGASSMLSGALALDFSQSHFWISVNFQWRQKIGFVKMLNYFSKL